MSSTAQPLGYYLSYSQGADHERLDSTCVPSRCCALMLRSIATVYLHD
jgi:hypothetical protein